MYFIVLRLTAMNSLLHVFQCFTCAVTSNLPKKGKHAHLRDGAYALIGHRPDRADRALQRRLIVQELEVPRVLHLWQVRHGALHFRSIPSARGGMRKTHLVEYAAGMHDKVPLLDRQQGRDCRAAHQHFPCWGGSGGVVKVPARSKTHRPHTRQPPCESTADGRRDSPAGGAAHR